MVDCWGEGIDHHSRGADYGKYLPEILERDFGFRQQQTEAGLRRRREGDIHKAKKTGRTSCLLGRFHSQQGGNEGSGGSL